MSRNPEANHEHPLAGQVSRTSNPSMSYRSMTGDVTATLLGEVYVYIQEKLYEKKFDLSPLPYSVGCSKRA